MPLPIAGDNTNGAAFLERFLKCSKIMVFVYALRKYLSVWVVFLALIIMLQSFRSSNISGEKLLSIFYTSIIIFGKIFDFMGNSPLKMLGFLPEECPS